MYTAGLVNPLKTDVALRRPSSLHDAVMLAWAYEQRLQLSSTDPGHTRGARSSFRAPSAATTPSFTQSATPRDTASSAQAGSGRASPLASTLPRRRLSPAEMTQRRAEGLIYNCGKKFVAGHRCKKLFVIEIVGFDDTESNAEVNTAADANADPSISLHAITGVRALVRP